MSTETTSPSSGGSELKPALASITSESGLTYSLSSGFTSEQQQQDNIDFAYSPRSSGLPSGRRTLMPLEYHWTPVTDS